MARVAFQNVSKIYDDGTTALKDFNLVLHDGEFVVLVGPSGCGKSTALRLLAGLEAVSSGTIHIDNTVVNQLTPQQRNIAMVFQNYALYPHMNVRQNLEFPLKMRRIAIASRDETITTVADILDLQPLLDKKPAQLSGGQRQRVAMGRALVRNPSVFLLDEPLSNLDAKLRSQIRADIAKIQKRLNKTTLYVTHDQMEAMTLGQRVAVMEAGKLHQIDTPAELYRRPASVLVAQFIGNPGMNILPATNLVRQNNHWQFNIGNQILTFEAGDTFQRQTPHNKTPAHLGFRPESISLHPSEHSARMKVQIVAEEFLGHETLLHFKFPQALNFGRFVARLAGEIIPDDQMMELHLAQDAICLFDEAGAAFG